MTASPEIIVESRARRWSNYASRLLTVVILVAMGAMLGAEGAKADAIRKLVLVLFGLGLLLTLPFDWIDKRRHLRALKANRRKMNRLQRISADLADPVGWRRRI